MTKFNFQELREFVCSSPKGKLLDSLISVEIGLEEYEVSWDAYQDMVMSEEPDLMESLKTVLIGYLIHIGMYLEIGEINFDQLVGATNT